MVFLLHEVDSNLADIYVRDVAVALLIDIGSQIGQAATHNHNLSVLVLVKPSLQHLLKKNLGRHVPFLGKSRFSQLAIISIIPILLRAVVGILAW